MFHENIYSKVSFFNCICIFKESEAKVWVNQSTKLEAGGRERLPQIELLYTTEFLHRPTTRYVRKQKHMKEFKSEIM